MGRALIGAKCKQCRRAGMKLFLKGKRCQTEKCALEKRNYPPGQHGRRRTKLSGYAVQLKEKQKVKKIYGIMEKQFRLYFEKAAKLKGVTGFDLLLFLERRLDNIIYRLGFASSRMEARQLTRHGHFLINGKRIRIPSYLVREGDKIAVRENEKIVNRVKETLKWRQEKGIISSWLQVDSEKLVGEILRFPAREEMGLPIKEQLIVELYSK